MLKTRNERNERRREGPALSKAIMPTKLRKMDVKLATSLGVSNYTIHKILHEDLAFKKNQPDGVLNLLLFFCCCRRLVRCRLHPASEPPTLLA